MNRDQRRAMEKALRRSNGKAVTQKQAREAVKAFDALTKPMGIKEGDKVMLDYDAMCPNGNWSIKNEKYRDFVETNKDKVFTAETPPRTRSNVKALSGIFQLAEDTSAVKWLFWGGHLKKVEGSE